ncbi:hypothetical protein [Alkalihalobacillus trypoxylicola]|uniref:Uncharacterized protein n=1 Tax=Alkalihalobacillus trypoxylicola TaxID=519424 RepID=A0A162F7F5_9BACI|nr:hypothetical protein [Alkalihalobacillus trypoxylicola]KYG34965.1 hypothetical protein AZF04_01125 [Alkalihalobacillus trypoxylicola]
MKFSMEVYVVGRDKPVFEAEREDDNIKKVVKAVDGALTENRYVTFGNVGEDEVIVCSENVTHVKIKELVNE